MKVALKIKIFVLFLLMCLVLSAQNTTGTLYFKDGSQRLGLIRLVGTDKVQFRTNQKTKAQTYNFEELSKVTINGQDSTTTYVQIPVENKKYPLVVEQVVTGKVSLYQISKSSNTPMYVAGGGPGGSTGFTHHSTINSNNMFVKHEDEKLATHLGSTQWVSKNFKRVATEYFKGCPLLTTKIQNREFKKKDIREMVIFYNNKCD